MKKYLLFAVLGLSAVFIPKHASADLSIIFTDNGNATATPGSTISISGTITNNSTTTAAYLNSLDNFNVIPAANVSTATPVGVSFDASASAAFLPITLTAGQSYSGTLAEITIAADSQLGDYLCAYNVGAGSSSGGTDLSQTMYVLAHVVANSVSGTFETTTGLQMPTTGLQYQSGGYANGPRLIQLEGSDIVYWVSPNNLKIPMWTDAVFDSYNNQKSDITAVSQEEFDYYQTAKYIRLSGNARIYKISGQTKQFIPSSVWNPAGIDPSQIIDVNKTDFNSYTTGTALKNAEELN